MKMFGSLPIALAILVSASFAEQSVTGTRTYTDAKLGLTAVAGTLDLPVGGAWSLSGTDAASPLHQIQVVLSPNERKAMRGDRMRKADLARQIEEERSPAWSIFRACSEYALINNGIGPRDWEDLQTNKVRNVTPGIASFATSFFLIPAVPIRQNAPRTERRPLALQLRPIMADGKHWVIYSDGGSERVPIDKALCARYDIAIHPRQPQETELPRPPSNVSRCIVSALVKPGASSREARFTLTDLATAARMDCVWNFGQAAEGDRTVMSEWAQARAMQWFSQASDGDAPVLRHWISRCGPLYGADAPDMANDRGENRVERADAFGVLGGRAAVRETLQMQPLRQGGSATAPQTVAIGTLRGVDVQSHPFDEMLKTVQAGKLTLADNVPADRAFVYFPKPETLLPLLDGGADFVFQGGSLAVANPAAYDLKNRYVDRLALSDKWVRDLLIKSGAIKEMAVFFPDLFFIDGTEVTVLARIPAARLLAPALSTLGMGNLTDAIQEKAGKAGRSFWTMNGDLLIIGTSRGEVEKALALRKAGGAGSLGQTAEFRYMLSQMPVKAETRFYCYLSDPFIRRLVGPEVKIGQLRRLVAKGEMENATAAAMLYRLDGQPGQPSVSSLIEKGYLASEPAIARGCSLDANMAASCPAYGPAARLNTILETPVTSVTQSEADAYKTYVENYSRFWRQYFDPMAFRLDDGPDGELQLSTFILPLVDNTIYNGLKGILRHKEDNTPLNIPNLNPKPLLLLSANLSEDSWTKVTREMFSELLRRYTTLDPAAFDKIGPAVHLAVHDADPILTFGAGDALGVFGAPMLGGRSEMLAIPIIASVLTRPCQIIVELQEPDVVRRMLLASANAPVTRERRWEPVANFYKVDGRDAWVCTLSIMNTIRVRFGVEIKDKYLILSNLPWSQKPGFGPSLKAELNTVALELHPEAGVLQMPGLFTAACEQERASSVQGGRYLYPFLAAGARSVPEAVEQCRALFGFAPEHPGKGQWVWENGRVRSSVYGDPSHPVQPEYKPGDRPFGVLAGLDTLNLNLQFEDAGLRVMTRWKMKETPGGR
jgi:hypothetical protein